jgi:hypothetical protein
VACLRRSAPGASTSVYIRFLNHRVDLLSRFVGTDEEEGTALSLDDSEEETETSIVSVRNKFKRVVELVKPTSASKRI